MCSAVRWLHLGCVDCSASQTETETHAKKMGLSTFLNKEAKKLNLHSMGIPHSACAYVHTLHDKLLGSN